MLENKTKQTEASVERYLAKITDEARRRDCEALALLMSSATKEPPRMWGPSSVGFGSYHYKYESGREGDSCLVGFSSRKREIALYGLGSAVEDKRSLFRLGAHKTGKGCLYIRRLEDIDQNSLEQIIVLAVAERKKRH